MERHLLVKRARVQDFLVFDFNERYDEAVQQLATWLRERRIVYREHILQGLEAAPSST